MENKEQYVWQELIESKDFDQLTNQERAFVLKVSSESAYRFERSIVLESKTVYGDFEPQALVIPSEKKAVGVPLYQLVLAVAASFVLGFFLFRSTATVIESGNVETIAVTDTVYVEKLKVDTVFQTETMYVRVPEQAPCAQFSTETATEQKNTVFGKQPQIQADFSDATLANKGTSASNDETLVFVKDWVAPN